MIWMEGFVPIDNQRIEDILSTITYEVTYRGPLYYYSERGEKLLEDLVREELTPKKRLGKTADEQEMIKIALGYCIAKHRDKKRDMGNKLYSTHPIDVARVLLKYDAGDNVDYITVAAALFHDIIEETDVTSQELGSYLRGAVENSNIKEKGRYHKAVKTIVILASRLTKEEKDYNQFLSRLFRTRNKRAIKIKLADRIAQSFEMDERQYYSRKAEFNDFLKHRIITPVLPKSWISFLKKRGGRVLDRSLKKNLSHFYDLAFLPPYLLYQSLEHLEIPADRVLFAAYKDFRHIDHAYNFLNKNYDPTIAMLKNTLLYYSMGNVITPRMKHLIDGNHVSQKEAADDEQEAETVKKSGELYMLTGLKGPLKRTDIIMRFYDPAMAGNKEILRELNDVKELQYLHLALWKALFERYYADADKRQGLFVFDWGPESKGYHH